LIEHDFYIASRIGVEIEHSCELLKKTECIQNMKCMVLRMEKPKIYKHQE